MKIKRLIFGSPVTGFMPSAGLLILRLAFGGFMLFGHGWGKLTSFNDAAGNFPDPLGIGSGLSLGLAVFAEVVCAALVMLGLATRLAVVPLAITMAVAALIVHGTDPFAGKELALCYLAAYVLLFFTGAGSLSLDALFGKRG